MSNQLPLFEGLPPPAAGPLADRFAEFHRKNPQVFQDILRMCDEAWKEGTRRSSIKLIFERLRWGEGVETGGGFELDNNFHAFYARLVIAVRPHYYRRFFETRAQQYDWEPDLLALGLAPDGRLLDPLEADAPAEGAPRGAARPHPAERAVRAAASVCAWALCKVLARARTALAQALDRKRH